MTVPIVSGVAGSSFPLQKRTNHTASSYLSLDIDTQFCGKEPPIAYRSTQLSSRDFRFNTNSSYALSSERDSIYNAEKVNSEELGFEKNSFGSTPLPNQMRFVPLSLTDSTMNLRYGCSDLHSHWSMSQLEPAKEKILHEPTQQSFTLRLQPGPERVSKIVTSQVSANSIQPTKSHISSHSYELDGSGAHPCSLTLSDSPGFPRSDTKHVLAFRSEWSSTSSEAVLQPLPSRLSFPLQPTYAPPDRSPTPPGLPSFRSREAQKLRLVPMSIGSRAVSVLRSWSRRENKACKDQTTVSSNMRGTPPVQSEAVSPRIAPVLLLRNMLGMSRFVEHRQNQDQNPRSSLPLRIKVATHPGALTQAPDGTSIRGRWRSRTGAHGVGTHGLDTHIFHQVATLNSIDEEVREIDKACADMNGDNWSQQVLNGQQATAVAEIPTDGAQSYQNYDLAQHCLTDTSNRRKWRTPIRQAPQVVRMAEPSRYGGGGGTPSSEIANQDHLHGSQSSCNGFWPYCCSLNGRERNGVD